MKYKTYSNKNFINSFYAGTIHALPQRKKGFIAYLVQVLRNAIVISVYIAYNGYHVFLHSCLLAKCQTDN